MTLGFIFLIYSINDRYIYAEMFTISRTIPDRSIYECLGKRKFSSPGKSPSPTRSLVIGFSFASLPIRNAWSVLHRHF